MSNRPQPHLRSIAKSPKSSYGIAVLESDGRTFDDVASDRGRTAEVAQWIRADRDGER